MARGQSRSWRRPERWWICCLRREGGRGLRGARHPRRAPRPSGRGRAAVSLQDAWVGPGAGSHADGVKDTTEHDSPDL